MRRSGKARNVDFYLLWLLISSELNRKTMFYDVERRIARHHEVLGGRVSLIGG